MPPGNDKTVEEDDDDDRRAVPKGKQIGPRCGKAVGRRGAIGLSADSLDGMVPGPFQVTRLERVNEDFRLVQARCIGKQMPGFHHP